MNSYIDCIDNKINSKVYAISILAVSGLLMILYDSSQNSLIL